MASQAAELNARFAVFRPPHDAEVNAQWTFRIEARGGFASTVPLLRRTPPSWAFCLGTTAAL